MSFWQLDTWKKLFGGTPTGATPNATGDLSQQVRYLTANYPPTLGIIDVQVFTASGTWNKPAGAKWLEVIIVAAGGGGGGYNLTFATCAGGGGGGARYFWSFPASAVASSVVVTIGAGGSGGGLNSTGGSGGQTKFGDLGINGALGGFNPTVANQPGLGGASSTFTGNSSSWQIPVASAAQSIYDFRQAAITSNSNPPAVTGMAGGTAGSGYNTSNMATASSPSYFGGGAGGTANNPGAISSATITQGPDSPVPGYGGAGGHGGSFSGNPSQPDGRPGGYPGGGGGSGSHNTSSSGGAGGNGQVVVITYG